MRCFSESTMLVTVYDPRIKNFHCGSRWKELAVRKGQDNASIWVKLLGLKDRNQVHYRWRQQDIDAKELIIICDHLGISIQDFFTADNRLIDDIGSSKKPYIEEQISTLEKKCQQIESMLLDMQNQLSLIHT